jgi:hypothetical protein
MKKYNWILVIVFILAIVTMACSISINLPVNEIKTGETQTEMIEIPIPGESPVDLTLEFGAGELFLTPGAQSALVEGQAEFNVEDLKPEVMINGTKVKLSTGDLEITGIPKFQVDDFVNKWNLKLHDVPMDLHIKAGAYQGEIDLGGLTLNTLEINDGAADVQLGFSEPNKTEMRSLRYSTGASNVELTGLANANFGLMNFRSGAGNYTLDFSGDLQRDANVVIESGISQVTIVVPRGTSAIVTLRGGLMDVDMSGAWENHGSTYILTGEGPMLNIEVEMGAGSLRLRTR